jgi:hypothetical protein
MRVLSEETKRKNKKRWAKWYKENKERQQKYARKYYKRTNKKAKIYAFRAANPDHHKNAEKSYYHANPEKFKKRVRRHKQVRKQLLGRIKLHYGCQNPECKWVGEFPSCCLEFHHVDRSKKTFEISSGTSHPMLEILKEVNKCTVVCANCHSQVHGIGLDASKFPKCKVSKTGEVIK